MMTFLGTFKNKMKYSYPVLFNGVKKFIHPRRAFFEYIKAKEECSLIECAQLNHQIALKALKGKDILHCVFFVVHHQVWKYDYLYRLMCDNPRFTPIILVCPIVNCDESISIKHMYEAYDYFVGKNYNVLMAYNRHNGSYVDVKRELSPDLIFYTNPYEGLIDNKYYIKNFSDTLTVYVPYAFVNNRDHKLSEDLLLRNLVWRCYVETDEHALYSKKYSRNKGRNVVVTGYPGVDMMICAKIPAPSSIWKNDKLKKVIWAPHHTIRAVGSVYYSCFLQYAEFMLKMAEKYKDEICFVFKPHPMLREKLYGYWGKSRTDSYFAQWQDMPNTSINEDDYIDLFLTSDGMIHDCGSFIAEYLYARKPVMRMMNNIPMDYVFNDFTLKCLDVYYKAYNEYDIESFLKNIIMGIDPMKEVRDKHYEKYLRPPYGKKPTENILNDIIDSIDNQVLYRNSN